MTEIVEIGKISSRGQVAIPSDIRSQLGLHEGSKVLFVLEDDTILMRKVTAESFAQLTKPLRAAKKKIREEDVIKSIHKLRQSKK
ncbi:AbrB/MazE/SpoVT family DNA-binding domain-containing protein [Candidatus Woesearchaeota archaeon]|nr:AbrB/MazE/SpoVT family DNA-binding domain-containing protein [Candidatus Woesearchaeota archaeon]